MTALVIIITIIGVLIVLASLMKPGPFDLPGDRPNYQGAVDHWKTVVYIQYKDNILMLKHKDHSFIEYYNDHNTWRKMPSMKKVDNDTVSLIEDYFIKFPKLRQGRGGVNV